MESEDRELERNGVKFHASVVNLENAVLALFYEEKMRLGTVAFAMPGLAEMRAGRSSVLLGAKYLIATRSLAERIAARTGKMSLVSLHTSLDEAEAFRLFARLADDVFTKRPDA